MNVRGFAGLLCVMLSCPLSAAPPEAPVETKTAPGIVNLKIVADPDITSGILANGLHYAVMQNDSPTGQVSIRLLFNVGSYEERDDQLGVAHLLEHMAFRSNGSLPGNQAEALFAQMGVKFGRDLNAFTTLKSTVYKIDLPDATDTGLSSTIKWLRGVTDQIVIDQSELDMERGVVLAEKEARNSVAVAARLDVLKFQAPGSRGVARPPIGTEESLKSISPERLRAFYDAWYRPENAIVVIAGTRPVAEMKALIQKGFEGWKPRGAPGLRAGLQANIVSRRLEGLAVNAAGLPTAASACHVQPAEREPQILRERIRKNAETQVAIGLANERLRKIAEQPENKSLGSVFVSSNELVDVSASCLVSLPTEDRWEVALKSSRDEFLRFLRDGPTEKEFDAVVEGLRSKFRGAKLQAKTRTAPQLADSIAENWLEQDVPLSPAQRMRAFDIAVEDMTPADVMSRLRQLWPSDDALLTLIIPNAPKSDALLKVWKEAPAGIAKVADQKDEEPPAFDRSRMVVGKPGKVRKTEAVADLGFTRFTFGNGTVLNFKQTKFEQEGVEVRVAFGHGRRELLAKDFQAATLASMLFYAGGLAWAPFEDVQRSFGSGSQFGMSVGISHFTFSAQPVRAGMSNSLQLMAAYVSEPGFRAGSIDARLPTVAELFGRMMKTDPEAAATSALEQIIYPPELLDFPPSSVIAAMTSKDFERILKPIVTTNPFEVTIVGDVEQADAIEAVAISFGALKPRKAIQIATSEAAFRRFPAILPPPIETTHTGPNDKGLLSIVLPLYVATPSRRREEYSLNLLGEILETSIRQRIRGDLGKTYSPNVSVALPDLADEGYLTLSVETAPADIDLVEKEVKSIIAAFAKGTISADMLEAARQPTLVQIKSGLSSNVSIASAMSNSARDPQALKDFLAIQDLYKSITLDDINRAAATWLVKPMAIMRVRPVGSKPASQIPASAK